MSEAIPCKVLFPCTGNSARNIMAEAIQNRTGAGRCIAVSTGSHPTGTVNPYAIDLLEELNRSTEGLRSNGREEFATDHPEAKQLDFVFTVCDRAAGEARPVWPGQAMSAHWGFPDPAAFQGKEAETRARFADVFRQINNRIEIFVNLPFESLDRPTPARRLEPMGEDGMSEA